MVFQLTLCVGCYGIFYFNQLEVDGKPGVLFVLSFLSVSVNTVTGLLLVPAFGWLGACLGTFASFSILTGFYLFYRRCSKCAV